MAPGQWTVKSKDAPSQPPGFLGPSARDLIGGNITFSMGGEDAEGIEFGTGGADYAPEDVSPRPEAPTYAG